MDRFSGRWFTATPMNYGEHDQAFWYRDVGVLCLGFQKLGVDSRMVAWGTPSERTNPPVILCTPDQMADANWWRQWKVDGVVLTSWGVPRFSPIAKAIKAGGARLVLRLDSDGLKSPRIDFCSFLQYSYYSAVVEERALPIIRALAKTFAFRLFRPLHDSKVSEHLGYAEVILVESPLARSRLTRWLQGMGHGDVARRIRVLVNPCRADVVYQSGTAKQAKILAVGRWADPTKDAPRLMKVIGRVLPLHQGYKAVLAGAGENRLQRLRSRLPADLQRRIEIVGHVENRVMLDHYLSARILLFTSRFEGFPFAVSEALCCGCTIVGAATVPALNYVCCGGGGTLAASRAVRDYADALSAEIDAWRDGQRDPEGISHYWIARASAKAVASAILGFFAQCAGSQTGSPDREDRLINP